MDITTAGGRFLRINQKEFSTKTSLFLSATQLYACVFFVDDTDFPQGPSFNSKDSLRLWHG